MNTNENNENREYELINLGFEYPGMTGGVKWAVITDLGLQELSEKYGMELSIYEPYVVMNTEQGKAIHDYELNEKKHDMRSIRHHDMFGYEEGLTEYLNSIFSKNEPELTVIDMAEREWLRNAIERLPEAQKRRCILYFYHGLDEKEIAKVEGVTQQMVAKSLDQALGNLKKFLKKF